MKTLRVLIADDSATARELLREILVRDGAFVVAGEAHNGQDAVDLCLKLAPDLVVMDVHMPVLDGLEATKEIMARRPTPIMVVSAVGNSHDLDLSLSATQAGALIALAKPAGPASPRFEEDARELAAMARAMANVKVVRRWSAAIPKVQPPQPDTDRPAPRDARVVAIAASTGGPPALRRVLLDLPNDFAAPILVVQHIARGFAAGFADWLRGSTGLHVRLARHAETARGGTVYIAPDDFHLGISHGGTIELSSAAPTCGFRPSADYLFESAGLAYGTELVAVIMTGMGSDGAAGLATAHAQGAYVIAQDDTTSVVYGMAAEAVRRGAVDEILPLDRIARRLVAIERGGTP